MRNSAIAILRFIFAISMLSFSAVSACAQNTIHVPGDVTSIQAGINAASNGDTVLVAPGTYMENIDFNGKSITVTSSGGASATIINGNAAGVVVTFSSGEGRGSVINGFTIQGPVPTDDSVAGGYDGIFVSNSNPTITNNIITENRGYGIELEFASAYISGNTVSYTKTSGAPSQDFGCDYDDGEGIFIGGTWDPSTPPVIDQNTIEYNVGHCHGGGVGLYAAPPATVISNNIIANNQSLGFGGGVFVINGSASLIQNLIYNNVSGDAGGGVYLSDGSGGVNGAEGPIDVFLTNNTIYGNTIQLNPDVLDGWVDGSQVALPGYVSQIGFFNNLIIANDSYSAVACWPSSRYVSGLPPVAVNNDVLNTGGAAYGGWCTTPADSTGNISADPKFKNPSTGDFHLQAGSPAMDAGFNAAPGILTTDISGNPRIQNATGASEPVVDMGVYEASGAPESRLASETTLTVQPTAVFYGQAVNLSTTVTDSSASPISPGTVSVLDDWSVNQQETLNSSGVATTSINTNTLALGPHWLISSFGGNSSYQPSISVPAEVQVNGFSTSTTLTFSQNPVTFGELETLTANVALASGNPAGTGTPTGSVAFYGISADPVLATVQVNPNGIASYTTSSLPGGTEYIQAIYQPTGGFLASESINLPLQVIAAPVDPGFTISGTPVNLTPGATTGNQSTITISPVGGFTGSVTLAASITLSPIGSMDQPILSFGATSPANIVGTSATSAILNVATTAPTTSALNPELRPGDRWLSGSGAVLACILLFVAPHKRKRWCAYLGALALLATVTSGVLGCGGSGGGGGGRGGNPGTSPGTYTITVTATSGTMQQTSTVLLTVN